MTIMAKTASSAMMWICIIYVIGLGFSLLFGIKGGPKGIVGVMSLLALCARICWIVTVPIIFYRLNQSMVATDHNLDMLDTQKDFVSYARTCGNPIYAMNVDQAENYMEVASENL